jgi:hypothetical protein
MTGTGCAWRTTAAGKGHDEQELLFHLFPLFDLKNRRNRRRGPKSITGLVWVFSVATGVESEDHYSN